MFPGCPLCNGVEIPGICPVCGCILSDQGPVENFYGPYSPYEERDDHSCVHLIYCPNCQNDFHRREKIGQAVIGHPGDIYQHNSSDRETK